MCRGGCQTCMCTMPASGPAFDDDLCRCPICMEIMFGKILLCRNGHGICGEPCFADLPMPRKCPQCRVPFEPQPTRGLMVEQIVASCKWNCKYDCGCTVAGAEMREHLDQCRWAPINCPTCHALVTPASLYDHYRGDPEGHQHVTILRGQRADPSKGCSMQGACTYKPTPTNLTPNIRRVCLVPAAEDVILVRLVYSDERKHHYLMVGHARRAKPYHCRVTIGGRASLPRIAFDVETISIRSMYPTNASELRQGMGFEFDHFMEHEVIRIDIEVFP